MLSAAQHFFSRHRISTWNALVSPSITKKVDAFVALEKVFNQQYEIGTPVTTLAPPMLIRGGIKVHFGGQMNAVAKVRPEGPSAK